VIILRGTLRTQGGNEQHKAQEALEQLIHGRNILSLKESFTAIGSEHRELSAHRAIAVQ
jgi:hypothetical protein